MTFEITPSRAGADLAQATRVGERVRSRSRWMARYLALFGVGFGVQTALIGLAPGVPVRVMCIAAWAAFVAAMVAWAVRRPAVERGAGQRSAPWWAATGVVYGVVLVVGLARFESRWAYWLPASALVALPLLIGADRERRR